MLSKSRMFILVFAILVLATNLFGQRKSDVNWFGYVRSLYQHDFMEDGENEGQFKLLLATMGLMADINEYSSLFLFAYFNSRNIFDYSSDLSCQDGSCYLEEDVEYRDVASLLDAYVIFKPVKKLNIVFGQFVTPFATENLQSASKTDFITRGYIVANSPAYRDIGAYANYKTSLFSLYAGATNGSGMNTLDNNKYKNVILRGELTPIEGLKAAGAASIGKDNAPVDSLAENQNFYSANLSYKVSDFYITAEGSYQDYLNEGTTALYAYARYDFPVGDKLLHYITPGVRFDFLDPPGDNNRQERYTFGVAFGFDEDKWLSLFRLNYEMIENEASNPPDVLTLEFQMRFE
ncbi:hypothetical protein DRQ19_03570 [bacterium]|nr:MAG: hypothetical protein DRQ19_03570 [bacterium]